MSDFHIEMNFCRRCGSGLTHKQGPMYVCGQGHPIFSNASPAVGMIIFNGKSEMLLLKRAIEPGKGSLDIPGGYCDGPEALEDAVAREVKEEVGLEVPDYTGLKYVISGIDPYDYHGEILPVSAVIFAAKMITSKQPQADDDAASAEWVPFDKIDLDKVYFPVVRAGIEQFLSQM